MKRRWFSDLNGIESPLLSLLPPSLRPPLSEVQSAPDAIHYPLLHCVLVALLSHCAGLACSEDSWSGRLNEKLSDFHILAGRPLSPCVIRPPTHLSPSEVAPDRHDDDLVHGSLVGTGTVLQLLMHLFADS